MSEVTTLIIDDEELGRKRIADLLSRVSKVRIIGESNSASAAVEDIETTQPDLIFLDIQLEDATGFDVLQNIKVAKTPLVIFVTAYDEFALKAFDHSAFDYLTKPFSDQRFYDSLQKAMAQIRLLDRSAYDRKVNRILKYLKTTVNPDKNYSSKLPIRMGNKTSFINKYDIKYITASGYYVEIHTTTKMYLLRFSLPEMLGILDNKKFIRIHRSTIINVEEILEIIHSDYGEIDIKMNDNKLFRLSKSHKRFFMEYVGL